MSKPPVAIVLLPRSAAANRVAEPFLIKPCHGLYLQAAAAPGLESQAC